MSSPDELSYKLQLHTVEFLLTFLLSQEPDLFLLTLEKKVNFCLIIFYVTLQNVLDALTHLLDNKMIELNMLVLEIPVGVFKEYKEDSLLYFN